MDISTLGTASVPAIVGIVYLICMGIKATALDNKWIPVIAGCSGGILGIIGMATMPGFPAHDPMTAVFVGIVSGLAATGINQVFKQQRSTGGSEAK